MKDPVPDGLRSRVVYKFVCAGCKNNFYASLVGPNGRVFLISKMMFAVDECISSCVGNGYVKEIINKMDTKP